MIPIPQGFRFAGVYSGVKEDKTRLDLSLVVSDRDAVAAGVYTQNLVFAAPVELDRARTPSANVRVVVTNSGCANACTGPRGLADAREMARLAATAVGAQEDQALVMSTGVIGHFLPMEKIAAGIKAAADRLATDEDALVAAARGMMTTDTIHKLAGRSLTIGGRTITITGMCKGAAMIGPNMATMLGLVITDAPLALAGVRDLLHAAADASFNCISVDGHMSTNDTVLLVANGAAGGPPLAGDDLAAFQAGLCAVCRRAGPGDSGRRRRGHAPDHARRPRLRHSRGSPRNCPVGRQ